MTEPQEKLVALSIWSMFQIVSGSLEDIAEAIRLLATDSNPDAVKIAAKLRSLSGGLMRQAHSTAVALPSTDLSRDDCNSLWPPAIREAVAEQEKIASE